VRAARRQGVVVEGDAAAAATSLELLAAGLDGDAELSAPGSLGSVDVAAESVRVDGAERGAGADAGGRLLLVGRGDECGRDDGLVVTATAAPPGSTAPPTAGPDLWCPVAGERPACELVDGAGGRTVGESAGVPRR
jgi:hypothetical protein